VNNSAIYKISKKWNFLLKILIILKFINYEQI
jgi:hypothetical protein